MTLQNKIDFALVIAVSHANPNGDPLNGNRPRETYEGSARSPTSAQSARYAILHDGHGRERFCPVR